MIWFLKINSELAFHVLETSFSQIVHHIHCLTHCGFLHDPVWNTTFRVILEDFQQFRPIDFRSILKDNTHYFSIHSDILFRGFRTLGMSSALHYSGPLSGLWVIFPGFHPNQSVPAFDNRWRLHSIEEHTFLRVTILLFIFKVLDHCHVSEEAIPFHAQIQVSQTFKHHLLRNVREFRLELYHYVAFVQFRVAVHLHIILLSRYFPLRIRHFQQRLEV